MSATVMIDADDSAIEGAVAQASSVVALLPALAQLTGDLSLLRHDLRPQPNNMMEPEGGLSEGQIQEAAQLAIAAIKAWRDRGCPPPKHVDAAAVDAMFAYIVGNESVDAYRTVLSEELDLDGADLRAPSWKVDDIAPAAEMSVVVVGAGMSGILAGHRLGQAGIPYVIVEKNSDVGGTWLENKYPGCRVDVANILYSYSFAPASWPNHFSTQATLLEYFRDCAAKLGVTENIRFDTEVTSATFDEDSGKWAVEIKRPDGTVETINATAVVSAVGQLNRPKLPDIAGRDDFAGPAFHSARWDTSVDLKGKRVAVIGTGASGAQLIPAIAPEVAHLTVFQRTPNWLAPTPDYHDRVADGMVWLLDTIPTYRSWYRLWVWWRSHEGLLPAAVVDPEWPDQERSVSAINELVRLMLMGYIAEQLGDRPDLLEASTPQYPPIAKRIIRDNGAWPNAIKRENVDLVTTGIERITATGVTTVDGVHHEVDVIVFGTGFHASKFLTPMKVTGRGGADLHDTWKGDARAYLGITVPGFPNLFCLYGPNTNIVINGSIIYFSELEVRYMLGCLRMLAEGGHRWLDVKPEVHEQFTASVDEANQLRAWGASSVNSWYKNELGRVAQNWPFSLLEYWERTREPDPADYDVA